MSLTATQQERQRYTQALEQLEESNDYEIAHLKVTRFGKTQGRRPINLYAT